MSMFLQIFFHPGIQASSRIQAKVVNKYESGTDCIVYFRFKNQETEDDGFKDGYPCATGRLDGPGNNWGRDYTETFPFECNLFQPGENLQFQITMDGFLSFFSCFDHLQLSWVHVTFNNTYFQWSGPRWFDSESSWINFDSKGEI